MYNTTPTVKRKAFNDLNIKLRALKDARRLKDIYREAFKIHPGTIQGEVLEAQRKEVKALQKEVNNILETIKTFDL